MLNALGLTGVVLLNLLSVWGVIAFEWHHLHDENHLFENLQALLLGLGVLLCSLLLRGSGDQFLLWAGLALLCLTMLLREIDLDQLPVPGLLQALGTGTGRAVLLGPLWLLLGAGFWRLGEGRWRWLEAMLRSEVVACQLVALAFLLGSALIDRELLTPSHPRLLEELFELNAYAFMIWPALHQCWRRRSGLTVQAAV